jgi:hypothetical protein
MNKAQTVLNAVFRLIVGGSLQPNSTDVVNVSIHASWPQMGSLHAVQEASCCVGDRR